MRKALIALVLGPVFAAGFVQAQTSITAGDVNALPGSKVVVPITISGGQDVSALQFTLEFDSETLTVVDSPPLRGSTLVDHVVGVNTQDGSTTFVVFSGSLAPFQGTGVLLSVIFEVAESAQDGATVELPLDAVEASDSDGLFVNVLGVDGSIRISDEGNLPADGENELIFPQIGNGSFPGGKIAVLMVFVNRTEAASNGEISFFKSDGSPFVLKLTDGREDSTFGFSVAAGESVFLETDGSGDVSAGYARLISTAPLGGTLVFTTSDDSETVLAEAGVGASPVAQHFSIPILFETGSSNTGITLANVATGQAEITLVLRDSSGEELARITIFLEAGEHLPQFADQYFDTLAALEEFQGSIEVWSSVAVSAIAIKTQGLLLTTFPVVVLL